MPDDQKEHSHKSLDGLKYQWETTQWVGCLYVALHMCRSQGLPPPLWLAKATGEALYDRSTDQEALGRRLEKHYRRFDRVLNMMEQGDVTLEAACAAVAEMESLWTGKQISEETVRKSYQRELRRSKGFPNG